MVPHAHFMSPGLLVLQGRPQANSSRGVVTSSTQTTAHAMNSLLLLHVPPTHVPSYNGTRYMFMVAVGANDLYEGLQQAAQLFVDYSIGRYNQVADMHTVRWAAVVGVGVGARCWGNGAQLQVCVMQAGCVQGAMYMRL